MTFVRAKRTKHTFKNALNMARLSAVLLLMPFATHGLDPPASQANSPALPVPRNLFWDDLAPKNWNPTEEVRMALQSKHLSIFDVQAAKEIRQVWDKAPPNKELNGVMSHLLGYVVPIARSDQGLTEFLLVAYFGACIQSQCPPANQSVRVFLSTPLKELHTMDAVNVSGRLEVKRTASFKGISVYRIVGGKIEKQQVK